MKIAVMQPYIFPYIAYFQLINSVDIFVFYDDVNYIIQGWINRNKILVSGNENIFTIPVHQASSYKTIRETQINSAIFIKWKLKFFQTLEQSYKKAPYFKSVYPIIESILINEVGSIADFASTSIVIFSKYIGLETKFQYSSKEYSDTKIFNREDRLVEIIIRNKGDKYINPIGGKELYTKDSFKKKGIQLNFIKAKPIIYKQFSNEFVPWLSIIDVLMFNNPEEIKMMLNQYELE
jgi:hypothetical protein